MSAPATTAVEERCRLCGGSRLRIVREAVPPVGSRVPSRFDVSRCLDCDLLQTVPLPSADELREIYEASSYTWQEPAGLVGAAESAYRRMLVRADQVRAIAWASGAANGRHVLDVGCGDGLIVAEARRAGLSATGVDHVGTPRCADCEESWKLSADLESFEQPAASWDVVSLFHVTEHFRDPAAMLRRMRRWLRPGGVLVVQVPNAASVQAALFGTRWYGLDVPRHLQHFSPATLRRLLSACGFETFRLRHLSWRDNGPLVASSLLPGLDPRIERERGVRRGAVGALAGRLVYFAAAWGAVPFTLLEAGLGRAGTVTAFARRRE